MKPILFALFILSGVVCKAENACVYCDSDSTESNKDSSTERCLIVRSYSWLRFSHIFRENRRLKVRTFDGRVLRGRLHLIDDTCFSLINTFNSRTDTFRIDEVVKINNVSLIYSIGSAFAGVAGAAMTAAGVELIRYPGGDVFEGIVGTVAIGTGLFTLGAAVHMINGKRYEPELYYYFIHSGNKKLRYWDLRKLYPR